jgi:F420-non-reducing hydrogenase iron-sulfur subunit
MKKRTDALRMVLEKLGLSPERFRVDYISAAEGVKFAGVIEEMTEQMKALGKEKIKAENEKLRPTFERMLARKKK